MHNRLSTLWLLACVVWLGSSTLPSSTASAQTTPPPPTTPPPATEPGAVPGAGVAPAPAPAEPVVPAQPVVPEAAEPTAPAEPPPSEPPPPPPDAREIEMQPQYGRLGGQPESEIQEGEWNPWDHPDAAGGHTHEGFFLRLQLGPGGSSVSREGESWSGMGLGMGLAIGGSPVENLALHLDLQTTWMFGPDRDVNGIGMRMVGFGLTWYLMPADVFFSGNLGVGWLAFEHDDGQSKNTSAGPAVDAVIGKEWWVGSDWGVGVAGQFLYMRVDDYIDDEPMDAFAVNVLFTATYN